MKYDSQTLIHEILRRSEIIRKKKEKRVLKELSAAAVSLGIVLTVLIIFFEKAENPDHTRTVYGSFILSAEAGGYVLVAVIAFIIGAAVAVLIQKYRKKRIREEEKK